MKLRRIDLYPDDAIAGMGELDLEERGFYETAKLLIYSKGGPITDDHLRKGCSTHGRTFNRLLDRMLQLGKIYRTEDGKLSQKRCETELKNARNRLETSVKNGRKGGRPASKTNDIPKPAGFPRAREGVAKTTITINKRKAKGDPRLGRPAPLVRAVDHAAIDQVVAHAVAALKPRRVVRDLDAYEAAVDGTIWKAWLDRINRFVMRTFPGQLEPLEAIEAARLAGSLKATSPEIRKMVNQLDKLERAARKGSA